MKHIKCVVVGDEECDKTQLLISFTTSAFPGEYVPTVFDNYHKELIYKNQPIDLQLWDTAGQNDYKKLRPLSYPQTDIFIVVFSLVSPKSLQNVQNLWVPEIKEHCPNTPFLLLGTKRGLRDTFSDHEEEYRSKGWSPINTEEGMEMGKITNASYYMECDSLNDVDGLNQVFLNAIKCGIEGKIEEDTEIYKIGLYSNDRDAKVKIALEYILGIYNEGKFPIESQFFKIVEANNKIFKVTININNPSNLSEINAMVFVCDIFNENSPNELKNLFDKTMKNKRIPYVVVADYKNNKGLVPKENLDMLLNNFNCNIFEIKSYAPNDIEDVFYYITKKIAGTIKKR